MKLIIDRERWLRGEGGRKSFLLRLDDRKMCCLGFYLQQASCLQERELEGKATPDELEQRKHTVCPAWLLNVDNLDSDVGTLMKVNDSRFVSDGEREKRITEVFAWHNVKVEFV